MHTKKSVEKLNLISMIIEGGFYFTGYTFFDVYVVIPVLVESLTGDIRLASLGVALKLSFYILPQLLMGFYTTKIKMIPRFIGLSGFIGRISTFLIPMSLVINVSPYTKVIIIYFAIIILSFGDGLTHVPWLDILGRTISQSRRGKLMGYQLLFGGIGGFIAGLLIKYILSGTGSLESRYSLIFLIGATVLSISGYLLFTLKDIPKESHPENIHIFKFIKQLPRYLVENKNYKTLIFTQGLSAFGSLAAPLYIIFAKNRFNLDTDQITTLMFVQIVGSLAAGLIWGNLSHHKGNKFIIQVSLIANLFAIGLALFLSFSNITSAMLFLIIMVFIAGILLGNWLGFINYLLDIVTDIERPSYIALTSTILFPLTLLPFAGGIIADAFGFSTVFIIVAIFLSSALIMSFKLKNKYIN